jgi:fructose-1,6-bisphosphatase II
MRLSFNSLAISGTVVIGEGEKDNAPMLQQRREGRRRRAAGRGCGRGPGGRHQPAALRWPNAISVVGVAPAGTMFVPGPSFYMQKPCCPRAAKNVVDIEAPVPANLTRIAKALGKDVDDLVVFVARQAAPQEAHRGHPRGRARIQLHTDGRRGRGAHGHRPAQRSGRDDGHRRHAEGVLAACAIRIMAERCSANSDPQKQDEKNALAQSGIDIRRVLTVAICVKSDDVFLRRHRHQRRHLPEGVRYLGYGAETQLPGHAGQDRHHPVQSRPSTPGTAS